MRFDTLDEAERHYKMFARRRGFGIRYNYRKRSEDKKKTQMNWEEYIRASLVCHKAGKPAKDKGDTQNPKLVVPERSKGSNDRTECQARMVLKYREGSWLVTEYCDDHNHPLINKWSLTGFLRSHRNIPQEDQD